MRAVPVGDLDDVRAVVADLQHFDPVFFRSYLDSEGIPDTPEGITENAHRLHLRWLEPTTEPGPPGVEADLRWVWLLPVAGVAVRAAAALRHD
jgi:hypothetical protein